VAQTLKKNSPMLTLEAAIKQAEALLYDEIDVNDPALIAWAVQSGLTQVKSDLRRALARQAAFELALMSLLRAFLPDADSNAILQHIIEKLPFTKVIAHAQAQSIFGQTASFIEALRDELPRDVLGDLYEHLIPQAERRILGQYWTPQPIVEFMARWAFEAGPRLLEPSLGSGRFIQALQLLATKPGLLLRGYEVSPLVLLIALVNGHLCHSSTAELDLHLEDFLKSPDEDELFDAVVCNPPYTRHHHIEESMKQYLSGKVVSNFGIKMSGFTSLFVFFFTHALTKIRQGGRLAFITPCELYEASYSQQFKTILRQQAAPIAIISFDKTSQVFDGVDTAACITLAQRGVAPAHTALIEIKVWPGTDTLLEVIATAVEGVFPWGEVRRVATNQLTVDAKWSNLRQMTTVASSLPAFGSVAKIMRGVATGANDYFCLSDEEVSQHCIPKRYLQPVITKTRSAQGLSFSHNDFELLRQNGHKVWLFSCFEPLEQVPDEVREYIALGERLELHQRSLLKLKGKRWYMAERREPPPVLFTYLSRGATRFIHNVMGAQALNSFLLAYPQPHLMNNPEYTTALVGILNSKLVNMQLHLVGRSYGGDTVKLEPREMDRLPIIDPTSLEAAQIRRINDSFHALCRSDGASAEQNHLDDVVQEIFLLQPTSAHGQGPQLSLFSDLMVLR
jgi:adenine-specific DNA-methyltransferase